MTESLLATFQQWLLISGVTLTVGCVAWRLVIFEPVSRAVADSVADQLATIERSVASAGVFAGVALVVAWALKMVVQVRGFRDPFVPLWDDVSFLLFETFWGTVWMAQGVLLPLVLASFARARAHSVVAWRVAGVAALGLVATLALSSHAMGVESGRVLFVTADAVHALAAGCWIGSLGVIVSVGRPIGSGDDARSLFAAQLRAFSPMALVSVGALIAMGAALSWTHLAGLSNLWETGYGRVLMAKIALAGGVFLAGFVNWRLGLPASDTSTGAVSIHRRAALEVVLAGGVLLVTAVLVHSAKP